MKIRGKCALVTGASRGIGRAIAAELVNSGVNVVITGRNADTLKITADEIGAIPLIWDVSDMTVMTDKFNEALMLMDGLDILVNNAGTFDKVGWRMGMLKVTEQDWDRVIDLNLKATFFMMQTAANYMIAENVKGNILNIYSIAANEPLQGPYGVSKAGVFGLTRGWGKYLAHTGIVVNGIAPGPTATEMIDWHEGDPIAHDRIPSGRYTFPTEIAKLAAYLLSEDAVQLIGHSVVCDGAYNIL